MNQVSIQNEEVKMLELKNIAFLNNLKLGETFNLTYAKRVTEVGKSLSGLEGRKVLRKNYYGTSVFHVEIKFTYKDGSKPAYDIYTVKEMASMIDGLFELVK